MILSPSQYASTSVYELLREAALGHAGLDRRLLDAIAARGEDALPEIDRFFAEPLEDREEEYPVDLDDALLAVVRKLRAPGALPFLAGCARAYEFDFPDELTCAFEELGAASIDTLLALHAEAPEASDVLFALAAIKSRDARVLALLTALLDKTPDEAAFLLGVYGDPTALAALEAARSQAGDNEELLRDIQHSIDHIINPPPVEEAETEDPLAEYPDEDEPYFAALGESELLEFLGSPEALYRARAVRTIALDAISKENVARLFDLARKDPETSVRAACWEALEGSLDEPGVRDVLKALLADTAAPLEERAAALVALAPEAGEDESIRRALLEFYAVPEARAQALKAMWHSMDRRLADYMARHVDDPDPAVRRQALWGVGWLGVVSQLSKLEELFDDEDLRGVALYSYALAAPGQTSPAYARKLFRKIEDLAGELSGDDAVLLKKALDDRLQMNGFEPIFIDQESWLESDEDGEEPHAHVHGPECDHGHSHDAAPAAPAAKTGRNDPCPCGSGKKYKKCCGQ